MQKDFENLYYQAEDHYLDPSEMIEMKSHLGLLRQRLDIYKGIRDQEIAIFQPVANSLSEAFPLENPKLLEEALKHWISVMRYGAMAMLLNNPDYFRHRLLEWLTDIVDAHEMKAIEQRLYELLQDRLEVLLSEDQLALLQPFLIQAQTTLLKPKTNTQILTVGENA